MRLSLQGPLRALQYRGRCWNRWVFSCCWNDDKVDKYQW